MLHLAETPQRWRRRTDLAICERLGANAAALDGYTRARIEGVAVVARMRASCAGADAEVRTSRVGSSPGVTIFTTWRGKLEIKQPTQDMFHITQSQLKHMRHHPPTN